MKKFIFATMFFLLAAPVLAAAPLSYDLANRAVALSAVVDAYGTYCEKPSTLAQDYLKRFETEKIEKEKLKELEELQKKQFETMLSELKKDKQDCKNVDFLLKRLEVMRSLKDVSYELNGIDPATVKGNVPSLEELLPDSALKPPEE